MEQIDGLALCVGDASAALDQDVPLPGLTSYAMMVELQLAGRAADGERGVDWRVVFLDRPLNPPA